MERDNTRPAKPATSSVSVQRDPSEGHTPQHAAAGLRWLFERYPHWNLTMTDLCNLLGGICEKRLLEWEEHVRHHDGIEIPHDTLERVSLLLGIHKALAQVAPDGHEDRAYAMFVQPIDLAGLEGRSIRDVLLEHGSVEALHNVRRDLDALLN